MRDINLSISVLAQLVSQQFLHNQKINTHEDPANNVVTNGITCQKAHQKAAVRSISISSDFPPSVGDIPDRDPSRANLCCDYQKVIMCARVKRKYRRCELSGGVGISNPHLPELQFRSACCTIISFVHYLLCTTNRIVLRVL